MSATIGAVGRRAASLTNTIARRARTEVDLRASRNGRADLALFHDLAPPPTGGGHQFVRALTGELERRGIVVERNRISGATPACLFNSYNFDFRRLRRFSSRRARYVHRVDGPIGVYRGFDSGVDRRIATVNRALADATVVQSRYSLDKHRDLGLELVDPVVIVNAPDPAIFAPPPEREPLDGRRVRIVATSWSDNPRKGLDAVAFLDRHLDRDRYELTFVGRVSAELSRTRVLKPLASEPLADVLRSQDVYLAASYDDPCSNALLEGLACGLPAVFRRSGGHPELVGDGGIGFDELEELPSAIDRLVAELDARRAAIVVPRLADVASRYLDVLGLAA